VYPHFRDASKDKFSNANQKINDHFNPEIYESDLVSITGTSWFKDKVINSYCIYLNEIAKNQGKKFYIFKSIFYEGFLKRLVPDYTRTESYTRELRGPGESLFSKFT